MRALMIAIVGLAMVAVGAMASEWEWALRIHKGDVIEEHLLSEVDSLTFRQVHFHLGACCLWDSYCLVLPEAECIGQGNAWMGGGTTCNPNPCLLYSRMIWIPAGHVRLGQDGVCCAEPHDVWIDGFWIGKQQVTNGEYKAFINAGGYANPEWWHPAGWQWRFSFDITHPLNWNSNAYHGGGIPGNESFPVNGVSWWEADAYCRWAGKRLPTEAEWEKAAKGGCEMWGDPSQCDDSDTPTYPWGEDICGQRANYSNSGDPYEGNGWTTPVGFYDGSNHGGFQTIDSPSPYGLYDVAGNVAEWTSTRYAPYPYNANDGREIPPMEWDECCRITRGGAWHSPTTVLRCAVRDQWTYAHVRWEGTGIRVASN